MALLDDRGQVLLSRRTERQTFAGMWEFPGGKVCVLEDCPAQLLSLTVEHAGLGRHCNCPSGGEEREARSSIGKRAAGGAGNYGELGSLVYSCWASPNKVQTGHDLVQLETQVDEADLRPLSFGTHAFGDHAHLLMPLYGAHRVQL